jgi:phosphatidylglycerophosphate synthase
MMLNVLLLADESADWKIAGLRQINRIALAINEMCARDRAIQSVRLSICWRPEIARQRKSESGKYLTRLSIDIIELSEIANQRFDLVISTRVLLARKCQWKDLEKRSRASFVAGPLDPQWNDVWRECEKSWETARLEIDGCEYLLDGLHLNRCERRLLRGGGKSHDDGFVSRYLNRPISRAITRLLLRTPITPNAWTFLIILLPMIGFVFLSRGDYAGFLVGALLYHLHSILDGCDGEIARARYLDSDKGPGFDALGDLIALLLFALGLSMGLFRQGTGLPNLRWFYLSEGMLSALLLTLRLAPHTFDLLARGKAAVVSSEHNQRIRDSGGRLVGNRSTSFLFQSTKRDVAFFVFLVLAIIGLAPWILHLLFVFSLASFVLVLKGRSSWSVLREQTKVSSPDST